MQRCHNSLKSSIMAVALWINVSWSCEKPASCPSSILRFCCGCACLLCACGCSCCCSDLHFSSCADSPSSSAALTENSIWIAFAGFCAASWTRFGCGCALLGKQSSRHRISCYCGSRFGCLLSWVVCYCCYWRPASWGTIWRSGLPGHT